MMLLRRLIAAGTLIIGGVWLASSFKLISIPLNIASVLHATFLVLLAIGAVMDWRSRHNHPQAEPSPARSAVRVIVATGAIAVFITALGAHAASQYLIPTLIAISTALLAFVVFRFASTHSDQIGEARFDSSSDGS